MERYIEQLIEDLRKARNNEEPKKFPWDTEPVDEVDLEEHFAEVERYVNGEGERPLSEIVGIATAKLPSPDKLTDGQADILAGEMEKLLEFFHFLPSFPDELSGSVRYKLLRDNWDMEHTHVSTGVIGIEFCSYDETECPIPGLCESCRRWKEEDEAVLDSLLSENETGEVSGTDEFNESDFFREKVDRMKDLMKSIPIREEYISGIYNYCDRWCERCTFTSRCLNFAMGRKMFKEEEDMELSNKAFWEEIGAMFVATAEMIKEKAEEMGIDLDAEIPDIPEEPEEEAIGNNPLLQLANTYTQKGHKWIERNGDSIMSAARNIALINEKELFTLKDAMEVIQWYNFFIYVKLKRAIDSLKDEHDEDPELAEMMAQHTNGTAKIALIAVDSSIAAFGFLLKNMAEKEEEILDLLVLLNKIRRIAEETFPDARSFIRPGFDE